MYEQIVVFDNTVQNNTEHLTNKFKRGKVIVFQTQSLPVNQALQLECWLSCETPLINQTLQKDVLLPIDRFLNNIYDDTVYPIAITDTEYISYIPSEYADSDLEFYLRFNIGNDIDPIQLRVYVFRDISKTLDDIYNKLIECDIQTKALIINQLAQDNALIQIATGVGIAASVISGGASLALAPSVASTLTIPITTLTVLTGV